MLPGFVGISSLYLSLVARKIKLIGRNWSKNFKSGSETLFWSYITAKLFQVSAPMLAVLLEIC